MENPNERNGELNRTGLYCGVVIAVVLAFRFFWGQYKQSRQCSSSNDKPNSINDTLNSINGKPINGKPL